MKKINLAEKLASFSEHWQPKVVAELNGQHVRVAKLKGEFVWHQHDHEDELFFVLKGSLRLEFRGETVELREGEMCVVPRGTEHRPVADDEAHVMLFEPAGTVNTGDAGGSRTIERPEEI